MTASGPMIDQLMREPSSITAPGISTTFSSTTFAPTQQPASTTALTSVALASMVAVGWHHEPAAAPSGRARPSRSFRMSKLARR